MTYLFDTHVWLWWTFGNSVRIPSALRREVGKPETQVFVSVASLWELAIKSALSKIVMPAEPGTYVQRQLTRQRFRLLGIDKEHIDAVALLPHNHHDPFDPMIVAQAKVELLTVVTADHILGDYDIRTLLL